MMDFQTLQDLRSFLCQPSGSKLKFAEKLFITLNFTKRFPFLVNITGACWLDDGIRFLTNSQIFGQLINLKPNSVNANFRLHSFKIQDFPVSSIAKKLPMLMNVKNYKVRSNSKYPFSISSTMNEISLIPCESPIMYPQLQIVEEEHKQKRFPNFLEQFVGSNGSETSLNVELLYKKIDKHFEWKERFFVLAIQEWKEFAGKDLYVDIEQLLKYINDDIDTQTGANISFLLNIQSGSSSTETFIGFDSYVKLVMQYGFLKKGKNIIEAISEFENQQISLANGNLVPNFKKWFKPSFNDHVAVSYLSDKPLNSWLLRPSSQTGKFTLHSKRLNGILSTHILFDSLSSMSPFSVEVENGKWITSSSLDELLFNALKLPLQEPELIVGIPPLIKKQQSVNLLKSPQFLTTALFSENSEENQEINEMMKPLCSQTDDIKEENKKIKNPPLF